MRRTLLLPVAGILTASFLAAPLAYALLWSPQKNIYPDTQSDAWFPRLAITPDGTTWVVWMGTDPVESDNEVYYSRWNGQSWDPPQTVNPPNQVADRIPKISCAADGTLWVLWSSANPDGSGAYSGLTSRWNGTGWSWPDTVWTDGERRQNTDLFAVSSTEAWFVREGAGDIIVYHHGQGLKYPAYRFDQPSTREYQPTITIDRDGIPWTAWYQEDPLYPDGSRVQFSRFVGGVWETPAVVPGPPAVFNPWITSDRDNNTWVIRRASDPDVGYFGGTIWANRWLGDHWGTAERISQLITGSDSTQVYLSVSKGNTEYPRAVWIRANTRDYSRYDVVTTAWDGSSWSPVELVGDLADSAYVNWPDVAVRSGSPVWVVSMQQPKKAPFVFNAISVHSIPVLPTVAARVFTTSSNRTIRLGSGKPTWCANVEAIGGDFNLTDVVLNSLVLKYGGNQVPALAGKPPVSSDTDGNGLDEIGVCFSKENLRSLFAGLPNGRSTLAVVIEGALVGGAKFSGPVQVEVVKSGSSLAAALSPNPFNPEAVLTLTIEKPGPLCVRLYDTAGRLVRTLADIAHAPAGYHDVRVDGRTDDGHRLSSGVYFYRVEAAEGAVTGRMVILK